MSDTPKNRLAEVAAELVSSYGAESALEIFEGMELPSPPDVARVLDELHELLFPGMRGGSLGAAGTSVEALVEARLARVRVGLAQQVYRGLHHRCCVDRRSGQEEQPRRGPHEGCRDCLSRAEAITQGLIGELPELRRLLMTDVYAAFDSDPAARGLDEIVYAYPGIHAIGVYRIAHALDALGSVIVPRMMTEIAHSATGIDIHPAARIGSGFFIDHGTGIVIGETTEIGNRVRVYQGVTLGALSLPTGQARQLAAKKRHPTIEDDVIIYANATILGGDTVIGRGAIIGGNCFVTESVPAGARRSL